jgi:glycosyltransferase involved in cell wall biosynthesis
MNSPKISVIMPVFNAEKFIHEAIESILNQTFTDFEFIIINDGSTDKTQSIILKFDDSRIKLYNNEFNKGLVFSLNKGIQYARGKYIARMDADDISLPDRLKLQFDYLNLNKSIGVVGSNYFYINEYGIKGNRSNLPNDHILISWMLFFCVPIAHPTVMMRASVLDFTNGYDSLIVTASREKYSAEDYNLWIRLLDFTMIANIEEPLLLYRIHGKNVSYINSKETILNGILIDYEFIKKHINKKIEIRIVECIWFSNFSDVKEIIQTIDLIIDLLLYHNNKYGKSLVVISDAFNKLNSICLNNQKVIVSAKDSDIQDIFKLISNFYSLFNNDKRYLNKLISDLYLKMSYFSFERKFKLKFLFISKWLKVEDKVHNSTVFKKMNPQEFRKKNDLKGYFTDIFLNNSFHGTSSISGSGSDLQQTQIIRNEIPKLFEKYKIKSFIDAPCGDFFWMQHVNLDNIKYLGIDIVKELIKENNKKFNNSQRKFVCKNIITDKLPAADIILIRDCWVHLSTNDIFSCVKNLKRSKIKYLLTTSFTDIVLNSELDDIWRPINLELSPYDFPKPLEIINEDCTEDEGKYKHKSLILWEIASLSDL